MSVYIPGMEMPKNCIECKLMRRCGKHELDYVCMPARVYVEDLTNAYKPRPDYCPLIELPPHGRLIDADALMEKDRQIYRADGAAIGAKRYIEFDEIADAPTIIPIDKESGE